MSEKFCNVLVYVLLCFVFLNYASLLCAILYSVLLYSGPSHSSLVYCHIFQFFSITSYFLIVCLDMLLYALWYS